jgi:hypothetical protein
MTCPNGGIANNNNTCVAPTTTPPPTLPPFTIEISPTASGTFTTINGYNILYIKANCVITFHGTVPSEFHTLVCGMGGAGGGNNNLNTTVCGGGGGGGGVQISDSWTPNTTVSQNSYKIVIGTSLPYTETNIIDSYNSKFVAIALGGAPGGGTISGQQPTSTSLSGTPGKTELSTTFNSQTVYVAYGSGGGGGACIIYNNTVQTGNRGQIGNYSKVYPKFTSYTNAGGQGGTSTSQRYGITIQGGGGGGGGSSYDDSLGSTYPGGWAGQGYYWLDNNYYGSGGAGGHVTPLDPSESWVGTGGSLTGSGVPSRTNKALTGNGGDGEPSSGGGGGGGVNIPGDVVSFSGGKGGSGVVAFAWSSSTSSYPTPPTTTTTQ